jgi:neutrophil factor 2
LLGHYDRASKDFEEALLYLRGNQSMYATQTTHFHLELVRSYTCPVIILNLGLLSHYILPRFSLTRVGHRPTLFSFLFLKKPLSGLSLVYIGQIQEGMAELEDATRQQVTEEHSVIDEAIRDRGEGYTVFSIVRVKECLFPLQS